MPEVRYSDEVLALMAMTDEVVPARVLAPIVQMHPSNIVELAKTGEWDKCEFIRSGKRYKFFRVDFLRKGGWIHEAVHDDEDQHGPQDPRQDE